MHLHSGRVRLHLRLRHPRVSSKASIWVNYPRRHQAGRAQKTPCERGCLRKRKRTRGSKKRRGPARNDFASNNDEPSTTFCERHYRAASHRPWYQSFLLAWEAATCRQQRWNGPSSSCIPRPKVAPRNISCLAQLLQSTAVIPRRRPMDTIPALAASRPPLDLLKALTAALLGRTQTRHRVLGATACPALAAVRSEVAQGCPV